MCSTEEATWVEYWFPFPLEGVALEVKKRVGVFAVDESEVYRISSGWLERDEENARCVGARETREVALYTVLGIMCCMTKRQR